MSTYDPMFGVLPPSKDNEYVIVKIVVNPMADPSVKIFKREPPVILLHHDNHGLASGANQIGGGRFVCIGFCHMPCLIGISTFVDHEVL